MKIDDTFYSISNKSNHITVCKQHVESIIEDQNGKQYVGSLWGHAHKQNEEDCLITPEDVRNKLINIIVDNISVKQDHRNISLGDVNINELVKEITDKLLG